MSGLKPRILISAFTFPPASNGIANAAYVHAKIMQELGCEVDVVTAGDTVSRDVQDGLLVARFPISGQGRLFSPHRGAVKELKAFLSENRWDMVFMHCWQTWSTNCLLDYFAGTSRTEKLILVSHGISTNTNYHPFPYNWIRRFLWLPYRKITVPRYMRLLTKLVVLWDHYDNDRYLDHALAQQMGISVNVIPNVARYNPLNLKRPPLRFSDAELAGGFLLSVGNYSDGKNERFVLDAYRRSRMMDVPLIFVGYQFNDYSANLEKIARRWELRKVQFCERLSKEEIDWLYRHATLFLSGSRTECQPLVILDCLASKTAYISTDVGCVKRLSGGIVVSSVEEMAAQLRHLLHNFEERKALVLQGRYLYQKELCLSSVRRKWYLILNELWIPA
jgi:glycosyltransferase involved in cell wall biosynthesis